MGLERLPFGARQAMRALPLICIQMCWEELLLMPDNDPAFLRRFGFWHFNDLSNGSFQPSLRRRPTNTELRECCSGVASFGSLESSYEFFSQNYSHAFSLRSIGSAPLHRLTP